MKQARFLGIKVVQEGNDLGVVQAIISQPLYVGGTIKMTDAPFNMT